MNLSVSQIQLMPQESRIATFENLLLSTNREGMNELLTFIRQSDFYTAPASTRYHSNREGGLLEHVLTVYCLCKKYADVIIGENPSLASSIKDDSIIISALLHDMCKVYFYKKRSKRKQDKQTGQWYDSMEWYVDDKFPVGHGEKSVIILQNIGLKLRPDEMMAIRWHMGLWGDDGNKELSYSIGQALTTCPLVLILQLADFTASKIFEKTDE